ncbi:MAG: alpha/beta hydrolase [Acidimicrobiales bacterium]
MIDPEVEALLGMLNSQSGDEPVSLAKLGVEGARASLASISELDRATRPEVDRVEDRSMTVDGREVGLRIYWPLEARACSGITVFFHGGGFALGSIETHDALARSLARQSAGVVVSVEYALSPEYKFPRAVEECYQALLYVAEHRDELLGRSGGRIAVAGDSAGGNLAAVTSVLARDRKGPELALQALLYPVVDGRNDYPSALENAEGYFLTLADMVWFGELYLNDPSELEDPLFSVVSTPDLGGLAPAVVVVAGYDPLRDQGVAYADRLAAAGTPVELWRYDSMIHGFASMELFLSAAREVVTRVSAALRQSFGG